MRLNWLVCPLGIAQKLPQQLASPLHKADRGLFWLACLLASYWACGSKRGLYLLARGCLLTVLGSEGAGVRLWDSFACPEGVFGSAI